MDKQQLILQAARTMFSQYGLKKTTTDDIARDAHVSKATVYKYYRNKAEIFDDVVDMESRQLLEMIRSAIERETDVVGKFRAHLLTKMKRLNELIVVYRVTQKNWGEYWPHVEEARKRLIENEKEIVREILRYGVKSGELSVPNINLTAHIMVMSLKSIEFPWAIDGFNVSLSKYVDTMVNMMIDGLRKR
ncbi:MAG: TetR/AcrR family transcriptional regulator [candidate division Zixibacteria bacterium]|nr:TetR/AcrR family transcriptional regulator [candidate division Zixibacteria bacterium]